jgi:hypothetical protein
MIETLGPLVGHIGNGSGVLTGKASHGRAELCRFRTCHDLDGAQCAHVALSREFESLRVIRRGDPWPKRS